MQNPTPRIPEYDLVAELSKIKGLDGQLVAHELGRLSVLRPGLEVWIVPPAQSGVRHTSVTEVLRNQHKSGVVLSLEGITDRAQASELTGRYLLARIADCTHTATEPPDDKELSQLENGEYEESSLSSVVPGTAFIDTQYGTLGVLQIIKPGPAYDIWVIDGSYGELEIPAVEDYITDEQTDHITLTLPKGFIEITAGGHHEQ